MEGLLAAIEALPPVEALRFSRWGYAAVNTAHVLGLATLYGSILALDLRLIGLWRGIDLAPLLRVLRIVAAAGLALAATTGAALFATRAEAYAGLGVFRLKMALVLLGTLAALLAATGGGLGQATTARRRAHGAISLLAWTGTLVSGRLIAFLGE